MDKKYFIGALVTLVVVGVGFTLYKVIPWERPVSGPPGRATSTVTVNPAIKLSAASQKLVFADNCEMKTDPLTLTNNKLLSLENSSNKGMWVSVSGSKIYLLPNSQKVIVLNSSTTKSTFFVYCGDKLETSRELFIKEAK